MKNKIISLIVLVLLIFIGCETGFNNKKTETASTEIVYSNLVDPTVQGDLRSKLVGLGISKSYIDSFIGYVNLFNDTVDNISLVKRDFEKFDKPEYDLAKMIEKMEEKSPDFIGTDCRITAFSLFRDLVEVKDTSKADDSMIFMDLEALESAPTKIFSDQEVEKFKSLYSVIKTEKTADKNVHFENIKKNCADKKISFKENEEISLVSVFLHSAITEEDQELFIGHTGLLIEDEGKILFLEKLAFQEPYQLIKFNNRQELYDYLMEKYGTDWGQETSKPIILENDKLLVED